MSLRSFHRNKCTRDIGREPQSAIQTNLQRPYIFVFDVHRLKRDEEYWYIEYSVANYGSLPAVIEEIRVGFVTSDCGEPELPPELSEDQNLVTSPILPSGDKRGNQREYLPLEYLSGGVIIDVGDGEHGIAAASDDQGIAPTMAIPKHHDLFFRVVIAYRGPFSKGHRTSALWLVREGLGDLVLRGDETYNHTQ